MIPKKIFGLQMVWVLVGIAVLFYLNVKYPFTSSPFWPWNRTKFSDPTADQMGSGTGNSTYDDEE